MNSYSVKSPTPMPVKKSVKADLKETAFSFIIALIGYYLIIGIWNIFAAPFRALLMSDKKKLARTIKIALEKKEMRDRILFFSREVEYDEKLLQRVLVPVLDRDKDELDSDLMAVPTIYKKDCKLNYYLSEEFLDYLQHQVELHLKGSFNDQHRFLRTIRKYYPEFTPKFSVITSEIVSLMEEAKSVRLTKELIAEVSKATGLNIYDAQRFVYRNENNPEKFKVEFAIAKKYYSHCLSPTFWFCLNHGYDIGKVQSKQLDKILCWAGNEEMAVSLIEGKITKKDFESFLVNGNNCKESIIREYKKFMSR
jgi:hypothetical protein